MDLTAPRRGLRDSGLDRLMYKLEDAKMFAENLISIYTPEELAQAVIDAEEEMSLRQESGDICILIPCDDSITGPKFEEALSDPKKLKLKRGERNTQYEIYGRANDAFHGTTQSNNRHASFIVYNYRRGIAVDLIGLDGKSLMSQGTRDSYLSSMESSFGSSVGWQERTLCESEQVQELPESSQ